MNGVVRFLQSDGTTVILAPTESIGYRLQGVSVPERRRRRSIAVSDDVDGDVEQQSVLDSAVYELSWLVMGSSGSQVETRRATLLAAAETRLYKLEVTIDSVTKVWIANAADSVTSFEPAYLHQKMRPVTLRVPVQPTSL